MLLFSLIALTGKKSRGRWSWKIAAVISVTTCALLLLYGFGELVMQLIYQREFDPWTDVSFISVGIDLFLPENSGWENPLEIAAIVLLLAVSFGIALAIYNLASHPLRRTKFHAFLCGAMLFLVAVLLSIVTDSEPISMKIARHATPPRPIAIDEIRTVPPSNSDPSIATLSGIDDADIHLFFIESYGRAVFSRTELFEAISPTLNTMKTTLESRGFHLSSAFLESPVSGGFSWIAEATFLTGIWVESQTVYDALLLSETESLPRFLKLRGYYTLVAMPGIVKGEWPEGISFYAFDDHLYSWDFGYSGPTFSYVAVPDQYTIWKTHLKQTGSTESAPLYAEYVLVSSHAPFSRIPPVLELWEELGNGTIYEKKPIKTFHNSWLSGNEYDEGYSASIQYVLTVVTKYLIDFLEEDQIIILVGDHQPKRPVRESNATKQVPIHLISRQRSFAAAFRDFGFIEGLTPPALSESLRMDAFYRLFKTHLLDAD
jgi:hypothetical protein